MQQGELVNHSRWTDSERTAIAEETERILADPAFKSSKRCQSLFRRLIEHALDGDQDSIKERTLGIEVFGRDANYDTATDPVVRVTANEIRKRLGQWYQEPDHTHAVRIRLVAGNYILQFEFKPPAEVVEAAAEALAAQNQERNAAAKLLAERSAQALALLRGKLRRKHLYWAAGAVAIVIAVILAIRLDLFASTESLIWAPLSKTPQDLMVCISDEDWVGEAQARGIDPSELIAKVIDSREVPPRGNVSIFAASYPALDSFLANKITNRIALHGKQTFLRRSSELTFDEFRHQPAVIIGGYNPWSLILLSKLRYSVRVDSGTHQKWIRDAQNPTNRNWTVADSMERADVDYAILSRFRDPETGQWIISLGGLWPHGTISACSLLTDKEYAQLLPSSFHSEQNTQLVIKTNVINGIPGPPQVIAVHTWK